MLTPEQRRELDRVLKRYDRGIYTPTEAERSLARLARPGNLAELLRRTPPRFAEGLREASNRFRPVRAVGYWRPMIATGASPADSYPDPVGLVSPGWSDGDRERIAAFLRAGRPYAEWRGYSTCRFRCGIDDARMGSRCLTDGEWVWPEGLAHYVEAHEVRLPEEFVDAARLRGWRVSDGPLPTADAQGDPDDEFWLEWSKKRLG